MLIISHRGEHRSVPENTLAAFQSAADWGFDGIETDVRLSADGRAILYHDRLAPNGCEVAAQTQRELSESVGFSVPTLEEALDAFPDFLWIVELKAEQSVERTVTVLREYREKRRLLVISFAHDVVEAIVERLPIDGGLSIYHRPLKIDGFIPAGGKAGRIRHRVWGYEFMEPSSIELSHSRGYVNFVYEPHTSQDHEHCRDLGVDGLMTDHPQLLLPGPDSRDR